MKRLLVFPFLGIAVLVSSCSEDGSTSASETTEAPSTTTTTTPATFLQIELERALPQGLDLPAGWSTWGGVQVGLSGGTETDGYCNGPNQVRRAVNSGAIGYAAVSMQNGERPTSYFSIGMYSFPNPSAAEGFVRSSSDAAAACTSFETTAFESVVDGFLEGNEETEWKIFMSVSAGSGYSTDADISGLIRESTKYTANVDNLGYSFEEPTFIQYDAYGSVVIVTSVSQRSAFAGYSDSGSGPAEVSLSATDLQLLDPIKKGALQKLTSANL